LSFFDEADEPLTEPRRRRPPGGGRRPPGGGRRSPSEQQQYLVRRVLAGAVLVVVVVVIALGIHSCEVSQRNTALRDYATSVASLVARSDQTGKTLFNDLSQGNGAIAIQTSVNQRRLDAASQLKQAKGLSAPDEMKSAQSNLVLALQFRRDAIGNIGANIQRALSKSGAEAVTAIAGEMGRLYASDVLYKDYASPAIAGALNSVGIHPNEPNGPPISGGQFVQNISWLTPTFVAAKLGAAIPAARGKPAAGTHGHMLASCAANGATLAAGATNTLTANPPPTFSCTFSNTGQNNESGVVVKVEVSGTSVKGQTVQPQTMPGHQYTVQVTLNSAPPTGSHTVTATVEAVPGETVTSNNTLSYPVTFH